MSAYASTFLSLSSSLYLGWYLVIIIGGDMARVWGYGIFFTLFVLRRTSDDTTSQSIWRTDAWAVPTSNLGEPSLQFPPKYPQMGVI